MSWLWCWLRDRHEPVRHPLGGFRCGDCGRAGLDLEDMGFDGGGYVAALRPTFSREHGGSVTRETWRDAPENVGHADGGGLRTEGGTWLAGRAH